MIEFIAAIFAISLALYCVFGGADFGGGILELFKGATRRRCQVELITKAMGPVWEANHMWLIIAIVITFNGFPAAYSAISIIFHVPLTIMLFGIVLRGCAFTFRHYDVRRNLSQKVYSVIFAASSTITPFMMGVIAGSCLLGELHSIDGHSYWDVYIAPWCNLFCFAVGLFTCCIFAFLAAVFLVDEAGNDEELAVIFRQRALVANGLCVLSGAFVFLTAWLRGFQLIELAVSNYLVLVAFLIATVLLLLLWRTLLFKSKGGRLMAALQVVMILLGFLGMMFPNFIRGAEGAGFGAIDLYHSAAGPLTLYYLAWGLVVGLFIILPLLGYLLYVFKAKPTYTETDSSIGFRID